MAVQYFNMYALNMSRFHIFLKELKLACNLIFLLISYNCTIYLIQFIYLILYTQTHTNTMKWLTKLSFVLLQNS